MLWKRDFAIHEEVVRKEFKPPLRGDGRVKDAHRSSRSVPWIHENLAAILLVLPVERFERFVGHQDFAAHFKMLWKLEFFQRRWIDAQRHRSNRLHIRRDILTRGAVAARNASSQASVFVLQRDA